MEAVLRLARKLAERHREGGWRLVGNLLTSNRVVPRGLWYLADTDLLQLTQLNRGVLRPLPEGFERRLAGIDDLDALVAVARRSERRPAQAIEEEYRGHLADGNACCVVTDAGRIVGYDWVFRHRYVIDRGPREIALLLGPQDLFFAIGYILPEYRLRGLFPHLVDLAVERFGPGRRYYTSVQRVNSHSFRSHVRLGFEPVGTLSCARLLGLPYRWSAIGARGRRRLGRAPARVRVGEFGP